MLGPTLADSDKNTFFPTFRLIPEGRPRKLG